MLRSSYFTDRAESAPQRSLLKACGFSDEELKKPLIAVVSAFSEIVPGHINLDKIATAVKAGVSAGGRPPRAAAATRRARPARHG